MDAIEAIKTRRVARTLSDAPVPREALETILQCVRWAPVAGNLRVHRYLAIDEPRLLKHLRWVSPGMFQQPTAAIVIVSDWAHARASGIDEADKAPIMDLGTAMQTIMLAAHAQGVASGPVTSFCKAGVAALLNLPAALTPEVIVCLGYKGEGSQLPMKGGPRVTWESLTTWNRFPED